jgi:hypothetical protein
MPIDQEDSAQMSNTDVAQWAINDIKPWQFVSGIIGITGALTMGYVQLSSDTRRIDVLEVKTVALESKLSNLDKQILEAINGTRIELVRLQTEVANLRDPRPHR